MTTNLLISNRRGRGRGRRRGIEVLSENTHHTIKSLFSFPYSRKTYAPQIRTYTYVAFSTMLYMDRWPMYSFSFQGLVVIAIGNGTEEEGRGDSSGPLGYTTSSCVLLLLLPTTLHMHVA